MTLSENIRRYQAATVINMVDCYDSECERKAVSRWVAMIPSADARWYQAATVFNIVGCYDSECEGKAISSSNCH